MAAGSILCIPNELFDHIFDHLSVDTVHFEIVPTCTLWRKLGRDYLRRKLGQTEPDECGIIYQNTSHRLNPSVFLNLCGKRTDEDVARLIKSAAEVTRRLWNLDYAASLLVARAQMNGGLNLGQQLCSLLDQLFQLPEVNTVLDRERLLNRIQDITNGEVSSKFLLKQLPAMTEDAEEEEEEDSLAEVFGPLIKVWVSSDDIEEERFAQLQRLALMSMMRFLPRTMSSNGK